MGEILHFRDFKKPAEKWANMEQFHHLRALGLVPDLPPSRIACMGTTLTIADTSPCEYTAPPDDPA